MLKFTYVATGVLAAAALMTAGIGSEAANAKEPYVFAFVPKAVNNIWFEISHRGCMKAEADSKGAFKCLYVGSNTEGGGEDQAQFLLDLVTKHVDGIAVSPGDASAAAEALKRAAAAHIPVLTWNSDLLPKDYNLRLAYVGTNNHAIGEEVAKIIMKTKPHGGTVCIQAGGDGSAADHEERIEGIRDTLAARPPEPASEAPGKRLTGENGWKEVDGCPLYYNDDVQTATQQLEDILGKYPNLDAFAGTGGAPQYQPDSYDKIMMPYKEKIASGKLAYVDTNTMPEDMDALKKGLSGGQIGQHPFEMGYRTMFYLLDIKNGAAPPKDPTFTGLDICTADNINTCMTKDE